MSNGSHIVTAFDDDLISVQAKISEMGGLTEELLSNALEAVQNRDAELAAEVVTRARAASAYGTGFARFDHGAQDGVYARTHR